jgi:hypothetical protein
MKVQTEGDLGNVREHTKEWLGVLTIFNSHVIAMG